MPQGQCTEDLRTSSLRILARMMAKAIQQKSMTGKELSRVELILPDIHGDKKSVPGKNREKRLKL